MILLPIIGQALYILFGQRYKYRKSVAKYREKKTFAFEERTSHANEILLKQANIAHRGIYPADVEVFGDINKAYKK